MPYTHPPVVGVQPLGQIFLQGFRQGMGIPRDILETRMLIEKRQQQKDAQKIMGQVQKDLGERMSSETLLIGELEELHDRAVSGEGVEEEIKSLTAKIARTISQNSVHAQDTFARMMMTNNPIVAEWAGKLSQQMQTRLGAQARHQEELAKVAGREAVARIQTEGEVEVAGIRGDTALQVAGIGAESAKKVAGMRGEVIERGQDIAAGTAAAGQETQLKIATIQVYQKAEADRLYNELGLKRYGLDREQFQETKKRWDDEAPARRLDLVGKGMDIIEIAIDSGMSQEELSERLGGDLPFDMHALRDRWAGMGDEDVKEAKQLETDLKDEDLSPDERKVVYEELAFLKGREKKRRLSRLMNRKAARDKGPATALIERRLKELREWTGDRGLWSYWPLLFGTYPTERSPKAQAPQQTPQP